MSKQDKSKQDKSKKKPGRNIEIREQLKEFLRDHGGVDLRDLYAAGYSDSQIKDMQSGKYTVQELLEMEPRPGILYWWGEVLGWLNVRTMKTLVTLLLAILLIVFCYVMYVEVIR